MNINDIGGETDSQIPEMLPYMSLQQAAHQIRLDTVTLNPSLERPMQGPAINKEDLIQSQHILD